MEITSLTNAKVKQWMRYKEKKHRDKDQKFLIEGEHLIQEAQAAGLLDVMIIEKGQQSPFPTYETYEVSKEIMKKLSDSVSGSFIMGLCHMPQRQMEFTDKVIILDDVQDPGNVGTIIRTAYSFGYETVCLSPHSVDVYNEKVIRSTQGAIFHMQILREEPCMKIMELKEKGYHIYATSLHQARPLQEVLVKKPFAFIFGNEGNGVSQKVLELSEEHVFIEMERFESLNVAIAAGICMYQFR